MKYIQRYNPKLKKVTYVKRRGNYTGFWMLISTALLTACSYLYGQVKTYQDSATILISPIPQEYVIKTSGEVQNRVLETPTPTPVIEEEKPELSQRTQGCIKNYPDVAKKLEETFEDQYPYAVELFCRESSLNPAAVNPSSGALGLVQALPPEKLMKDCPDMGLDCQVKWGQRYIENRYGSAEEALAFHDLKNWY